MRKRKVRLLGSCPTHGTTVKDEESGAIGTIAPARNGELLNGREIVSLREERNDDGTHDLTTLYDGTPVATHKGPARVTTNAYRDSWDRVFGKDMANYFERNMLEETLKKHLTVAEKYMATPPPLPLPPGAAHASDCPCGTCP